jgi:hypothetical protein
VTRSVAGVWKVSLIWLRNLASVPETIYLECPSV